MPQTKCNALMFRPIPVMRTTGGPLKPGVGLSGAVPRLDIISPRLVRASLPPTRIQSPRVPHRPSHTGDNYSTPSLPLVHTTSASPDSGEYSAAFPRTADGFEC